MMLFFLPWSQFLQSLFNFMSYGAKTFIKTSIILPFPLGISILIFVMLTNVQHMPSSYGKSKKTSKTTTNVDLKVLCTSIFYRLLFSWEYILYLTRSQLRLCQQHQVVVSARFGVGTRHVKAAERMHAYKGSCTFAVDVQVTAMNGLQR